MLFKKSRLLVFYAEFTVYGGKYSLHLTQCEHASEERISGIVVALFVAEHRHSVVYRSEENTSELQSRRAIS